MRDGLFIRLLLACAPLLLWAVHFFMMYALAALDVKRWVMVALSVAFILAVLALMRQSIKAWQARGASLHRFALCVNAVLAAIAIGWSCVPLVLLSR